MEQAFSAKLPDNLDSRESAVYTLALMMTRLRGPLDDSSFEQASLAIGRDGVAGVSILLVAIYMSPCCLASVELGHRLEYNETRNQLIHVRCVN